MQEKGLKRLVYFHAPVMVMMVTNLALYVVTVFHLNKHHQQTRAVRQSRRLIDIYLFSVKTDRYFCFVRLIFVTI